jgi:hypothetical protein
LSKIYAPIPAAITDRAITTTFIFIVFIFIPPVKFTVNLGSLQFTISL